MGLVAIGGCWRQMQESGCSSPYLVRTSHAARSLCICQRALALQAGSAAVPHARERRGVVRPVGNQHDGRRHVRVDLRGLTISRLATYECRKIITLKKIITHHSPDQPFFSCTVGILWKTVAVFFMSLLSPQPSQVRRERDEGPPTVSISNATPNNQPTHACSRVQQTSTISPRSHT